MRKMIAVMLMVFFCFGCFSACHAEGETLPVDISFRDIPWQSSVEEVFSIINNEFGTELRYRSSSYFSSREYGVFQMSNLWIDGTARPDNLKVAGFPVTYMEFFFLPEYDVEQHTISENEGKLMMASYRFDDTSYSFENEIIEKLDALYGEHDTQICKVTDYSGPGSITRWQLGNAKIELLYMKQQVERGGQKIYIPWHYILLYTYEPETLVQDSENILSIQRFLEQEAKRQEQEQKEREREERGTDGL